VRPAAGRGSSLHNPRGSSTASDASQTAQNPQAGAMVLPRRSRFVWPVVQQCQEFIVQLAWREVREGATTTVARLKDAILAAYERWVPMFLDGSVPAENSSYPSVPQSLLDCDRNEAIAVLHYSTGTGGANLSKDALYRKAKSGTTKLLKYMGNWLSVCKDPNTNAAEFTPSVPPSGKDRDWVWLQIKKTEHRIAQCLKIYKSRIENRQLGENSPEAIKESLTHLIFAKRGRSLEEEMELRGMSQSDDFASRSHAFQREEEQHLRDELRSIFEEVDAGYCSSEDDEDGAPRPTSVSSASSSSRPTSNVPRTYFEVPYSDHAHHVHEFTFKAFTQYAGHGHTAIAQFYTSEWADYRRTQANSGGFGRTHQRVRQQNLSQHSQRHAQSDTQSPSATTVSDSQSAVADMQSNSTNQLVEIGRHMQVSNHLSRVQVQISNLEKAVALATKLGKPPIAVTQLEECLFGEYLRSAGVAVPVRVVELLTDTSAAAQSTSVAAQSTSVAANLSTRSPARSRPRLNPVNEDTEQPWQKAQRDIYSKFRITENAGKGNCLFIVLKELWDQHQVFVNRRVARSTITHQQVRALVVSILRENSSVIRLGTAVSVVNNSDGDQSFDVFVREGMIQQKGSIDTYCDWMATDGVSGRFAGLVCEVL
jgi:hypothetical protein